jgi:hypothetical protein
MRRLSRILESRGIFFFGIGKGEYLKRAGQMRRQTALKRGDEG